ncbi:hypothetical protein HDV00_003003 [Rhizophlyctis rosea]|nr:hypothetical protein HDV00_003003 [Rhizophlyctis rosea]
MESAGTGAGPVKDGERERRRVVVGEGEGSGSGSGIESSGRMESGLGRKIGRRKSRLSRESSEKKMDDVNEEQQKDGPSTVADMQQDAREDADRSSSTVEPAASSGIPYNVVADYAHPNLVTSSSTSIANSDTPLEGTEPETSSTDYRPPLINFIPIPTFRYAIPSTPSGSSLPSSKPPTPPDALPASPAADNSNGAPSPPTSPPDSPDANLEPELSEDTSKMEEAHLEDSDDEAADLRPPLTPQPQCTITYVYSGTEVDIFPSSTPNCPAPAIAPPAEPNPSAPSPPLKPDTITSWTEDPTKVLISPQFPQSFKKTGKADTEAEEKVGKEGKGKKKRRSKKKRRKEREKEKEKAREKEKEMGRRESCLRIAG